MPKRILIFSTAYFPLVGGAEVAVKEITNRLPEFEFVMLTAKIKPELQSVEKIGNVEVHRIGKGNHWDKFRLIWSGWKEAKKLGKFNAVWSIMASYSGFAALRFKKRNPSVPFLLTLQEGDSRYQIYKHVWWCWLYFKQIFKRANHVQAISTYLAKWARSLGATCPVEVVPNGVEIERFNSSVIARKPAMGGLTRQSHYFQCDCNKRIITVSRLVKKNGLEDLISALQFLPDTTHVVIAGEGELKPALTALTEKLQLTNRVHFLGTIENNQLPQYLWASDVFCRPSLSEGLGIAFLEAMAAGVPVVATNVGGISDFLNEGETGLFCKVRDPKDIAEKINRILNDQALAEKLRTNGLKLVQEKYSWDTVAQSMKTIFNNLSESVSQSV